MTGKVRTVVNEHKRAKMSYIFTKKSSRKQRELKKSWKKKRNLETENLIFIRTWARIERRTIYFPVPTAKGRMIQLLA